MPTETQGPRPTGDLAEDARLFRHPAVRKDDRRLAPDPARLDEVLLRLEDAVSASDLSKLGEVRANTREWAALVEMPLFHTLIDALIVQMGMGVVRATRTQLDAFKMLCQRMGIHEHGKGVKGRRIKEVVIYQAEVIDAETARAETEAEAAEGQP